MRLIVVPACVSLLCEFVVPPGLYFGMRSPFASPPQPSTTDVGESHAIFAEPTNVCATLVAQTLLYFFRSTAMYLEVQLYEFVQLVQLYLEVQLYVYSCRYCFGLR